MSATSTDPSLRSTACATAGRGGSPDCHFCPVHARCLVRGADSDTLADWRNMMLPGRTLRAPGTALFEAGDAADTLYFVRSGCIKTCTIDRDGSERVRALYLPGDIIGIDTLDIAHHRVSAVAVTPSQVCALPSQGVLAMMERTPLLMRRLARRMSHALAEAQALAGENTADERVAAFLLHMQARLPAAPSGAIQLPMTRRDIANYLRLATETVSRVITRFAARGLIRTDRQRILIDDKAALAELAAAVALPSPVDEDTFARRAA